MAERVGPVSDVTRKDVSNEVGEPMGLAVRNEQDLGRGGRHEHGQGQHNQKQESLHFDVCESGKRYSVELTRFS